MSLFQLGPFMLPSGEISHFKIECDFLTEEDYASLARLAVEILPPFGAVEGVPRGGIPFADELKKYVSPGSKELLIADDVWVSGLSMKRHKGDRQAIGIVAFYRGQEPLPWWCYSLFNMERSAELATYTLDRPHQGYLNAGG